MHPTKLRFIVDELLRKSAGGDEVSIDQIGDVLGTASVSIEEIEAIVSALEAAGRTIAGGMEGDPKQDLRTVVQAVHELRAEGRRPTVALISSATGLTEARVRTALRLGQVIGR